MKRPYFGFEAINEIIDRGGEFKAASPAGAKITDIDSSKDLIIAKKSHTMKTKILIKIDSSLGYNPTLDGICSVLSLVNDGIYIWDADNQPAYDSFYECQPEVLVCMDRGITPTLSNVLKEYKDTKTIAIGPDIPDYFNPSLACYGGASGDGLYDLQPAANLIDFPSRPTKEKYKSEISIISDNESSILGGLSDFAIKCFSYTTKLKHPNYIGRIFPDEISSILASCSVYLDTDGHNDLLLAAMANRCPCLSANKTIFEAEYMPKVASLEELIDCLKMLAFKKTFREEHVEKCYKFTVENHTYFHRMSDIFSLLGYEEHSEDCIKKIEEYL